MHLLGRVSIIQYCNTHSRGIGNQSTTPFLLATPCPKYPRKVFKFIGTVIDGEIRAIIPAR